jgi:hypothetical protein
MMRRWKLILATFLCAMVFVFAVSSTSNAANADQGSASENKAAAKYSIPDTGTLVPKTDKREDSSSIFWKYGLGAFVLDYKSSFDDPKEDVKEDCDVSWTNWVPVYGAYKNGKCLASAANAATSGAVEDFTKYLDISFYINTYNTMLWQNYIVVAFCLVKFVSWAFTLEIITLMLNAYQQAMLSLQETLWKPLMYLMWAVAVAWMVYYWISGKSTKLWSTFLNSIIIIALSATLFTNLPTFLQSVSNASTDVSVTILSGLVNQNSPENGNNTTAETHRDAALNTMEDNMSGILLDLPYVLINFGSPKLANAIGIDNVLKHGTNGEKRNEALQSAYKRLDDDGKKQMEWMTSAKAPERLANSVIIMLFALAVGICFCIVAALCIIWQFIALGRGLLAAVYLVIGLWPEYGLKEFFLWFWSMIQALFMKVFYTIVLAIYIIMVVALASEVDDMGFLLLWLLAIGMFIGLAIALKELREKLTSIPLGNGVFLKGTTNEAEQVLEKVKNAGEKALGYGTAIAGMAAGNPMVAKAGLAMAKRGVGGAVQSTAHDAISSGADKIKSHRAEKKEKKAAEKAYEDRVDGLHPEDAQFANYVRNASGIDVTTADGQEMLKKAAPDFAKNNAAALSRIGENTLAREMAKAMPPGRVPPKDSLERELLSRKFGEDNVNLWADAQTAVDGRLQKWNALTPEQKANTPKPKTDRAAVQKQFEKMQMGNRLNSNFQQMVVDNKNTAGDQVYADFTQFRQQLHNKNAIGDKVLANFKNQVAKTGSVVIDLNQMSMGKMGSIGDKSLNVKVTGNLSKHLPNTAAETQKVMESVQKQIVDKLRVEGIQANNIQKPVTVKVDVPVGGGGAFGTQKVDLVVDKVSTGGSSGATLDPQVLRDQIKGILATASRESTISTPQKIELASNFIVKHTGVVPLADQVKSATNIETELQKSLNFVSSNSGASVDAFASSDVLSDFMKLNKKEYDTFEKQIRKMQRELGLQANHMTSAMESFQADVKDVIKTINKIKQEAENANNPSTPPSGGGGSAKT